MKRVVIFLKREIVLTIAIFLAIISAFIVTPDSKYIEYIDCKSLSILWCLMVVVAGFRNNGIFEAFGGVLLKKIKNVRGLMCLLVFLPFFFSMFITNDVALLTFVPFAIYILEITNKKELLIKVVSLQTIAANLSSMFTPIGNPQNLYLYGMLELSIGGFLMLMLPYVLMSFILLVICILTTKNEKLLDSVTIEDSVTTKCKSNYVYGALFLIAVLSVAFPSVIRYQIVVIIVFIAFLIFDRKVLVSVDYTLLFTFVGFFVFTGNLGRIDVVKQCMQSLIDGHEVIVGVISSQAISNVPAALLLSEFTKNIDKLTVGVNLGGLGTLIASMASLISFKLLTQKYNELKGKYLKYFSVISVIFLIILLVGFCVLEKI